MAFRTQGHPLDSIERVDATSPSRQFLRRSGRDEDVASTAPKTYFDSSDTVGFLRGGNLPHWRQQGATYFVTWRTADSMPEARVTQWLTEREQWLEHHLEPHDDRTQAEYDRLFSERWEIWLDECHGACELRNGRIRDVIAGALRHFDGDHYRLDDEVVMPNHVHVLVTPFGAHTLSEVVRNWKSFTAHAINGILGRKGTFWQKESFDHIVRSAEGMARIRAYIGAQRDDATRMSLDWVDATLSK